jgi:DNA-binding NarL/FixJ family response regulator
MAIDAMMHKSSSAEELVATIGAVSRDTGGDNVVISMPRSLLQRLSEGSSGGLSERKTEVLVLAARGLSNRLIAEGLSLLEAPSSATWPTSTRTWACTPGTTR